MRIIYGEMPNPLLLMAMIKTGRGEHRSSADCQWQPLLSYLTDLFYVDFLREQTIVRHDFVLLILFSRWRRLFVLANYFVQFSKLKFNDIFTCVR